MLYTTVSVLVGFVLATDAIMGLRSDSGTSSLSNFASVTEIMWMVISFVHLTQSDLYGLPMLMPALFIAYVLAGFMASFFWLKNVEADDIEKLNTPAMIHYISLAAAVFIIAGNGIVLLYS
ncbi:MAG: hypothetical protein LAT67_15785 [Balneolales bacterium]|nr:hypothetical protein [Balneolales bacterium]